MLETLDTPATAAKEKSAEARRLESRAAKKRQIAEREVTRQRAGLLQNQIAELDTRADGAADVHKEQTEPAQSRLAEIENEIAACLADRLPVPHGIEAERVTLLQEIQAANETLEKETATIQKLRDRLERDRRDLLATCMDWEKLTNDLTREPLANPDLLLLAFVAEQTIQWADRRHKHAREYLAQAKGAADSLKARADVNRTNYYGNVVKRGLDAFDMEQLQTYETRAARWQAEERAVSEALAEAHRTAKAIRQQLLDE